VSTGTWGLRRGQEIDASLVVIDHLGGGSRYEVFRAWDRELFCNVAVKVVRPDRLDDERALAGFEREVSLARELQHPNLVRLLRWSVGARPYVVLGLVEAGSLGDHLVNVGPVSIPEACVLGVRMAGALHFLHRHDVLHLDVKPANVTIGSPPVLLDLGLARTVSGRQKLRTAIGTQQYMPPEQCAPGSVTTASDIFALGATIYEGVSGERPFPEGDEDADDQAARYPQLELDPVPLGDVAHVPAELESLVMRCLARDPDRRPRSAAQLAVAFERVLEQMKVDELLVWPRGTAVMTSAGHRGR
jgi:serine/threonine protein kinase